MGVDEVVLSSRLKDGREEKIDDWYRVITGPTCRSYKREPSIILKQKEKLSEEGGHEIKGCSFYNDQISD